MYDLIIIGAGPAGITAAVYAARKKINTLVITKDIGGQAAWSGDIENYTGYQFITGPDLAAKFEEHLKQYGLELKESQEVTRVFKEDALIQVEVKSGRFTAKAVIVASGKFSRKLGVPGENEFKNRGLTYCATCDGPLFAGKDVAVIGGGNSALDAALSLERICHHVYIVNNTEELGGDLIMRQKVLAGTSITIFNKARVLEILPSLTCKDKSDPRCKMLGGIKISLGSEEKIIDLSGVFVEIGLTPNADLVPEV